MLCDIKIIFFVKNTWQNSSYTIKDNEIVTSYRATIRGRNRNGFLLIKCENIISQTEWPMWRINIYVVAIMENAKNKNLKDLRQDRNKYLNNPPINDNI